MAVRVSVCLQHLDRRLMCMLMEFFLVQSHRGLLKHNVSRTRIMHKLLKCVSIKVHQGGSCDMWV